MKLAALALALLVNLGLFGLMAWLTTNAQAGPETLPVAHQVRFVRPQASPDTAAKPRHRELPPEPTPPERSSLMPELPVLAMPPPAKPNLPTLGVDLAVPLSPPSDLFAGEVAKLAAPPVARPGPATAPSLVWARELTAIVTSAPRYPAGARLRGQQGFVLAEFSVDVAGKVRDIAIRQAEPEGVFELAARTAISRWLFQPHQVDGEPVEIRVRQRIDFRLESD